ncbi:trigger factor [Candidatus Wirthbacteria bacterium CG2_30_54_11]|uniref:Trigger factor n=1 Tax=Candidatus Wirthbacteria bacterium CG2_30_54_11 TaxID=1817892 RepID=A0A1J5IJZ0_9BACT|nr:MAG: trigger factor [Candidatus Wirthbacteria bacterium CG2_30_54_11]
MEIALKHEDKSQIKITITISPEEVAVEKTKAFERLRQHLRLQGFRPGKVPAPMAQAHIHEADIRSDLLETCVPTWYLAAVREQKLHVISDPSFDLQTFEDGKPLTFSATVTVYPDVKLGEYKKIRAKTKKVTVKQKDIDEAIDSLRERQAKFETKAGKAEKEDVAAVSVQAHLGEEEVKAFTRESYEIVLGEGYFAPGFDDKLIGCEAGQALEFSLPLPDSYPIERFKGKSIDFKVQVKEIKKRTLPELNDDFAKSLKIESLTVLKEQSRQYLEEARTEEAQKEFREEVLKKASDCAKFDLPEVLVIDELDRIQREFEWRLKQQGFSMELYLKTKKTTLEDMQKDWRPQAETIAHLEVALDAIAREEKIEVADQELEAELGLWLQNFRDQKGGLTVEGHRLQDNLTSPNGRVYLAQLIRREKTKKYLYGLSTGEDKVEAKTESDAAPTPAEPSTT